MALQFRLGLNSERLLITPLEGEPIYCTDTREVWIGDGETVGGRPVTVFTVEDAQDAFASMLSAGTHTGISFEYNDSLNSLSLNVGGNIASDIILNTHNITGTGNININGSLDATKIQGRVVGVDQSTIIDPTTNSISGATGSFTTVTLGNDAADGNFHLYNSRSSLGTLHNIVHTDHTSFIEVQSRRGTFSNAASVQEGDNIGGIKLTAWTGTTNDAAVTVRGIVDSTPSATAIPGRFEVAVRDSNNSNKVLSFNSQGTLAAPSLQVHSYPTVASRDAALPIPVAGMITYIADIDGNGTPAFQGYKGGSSPGWVTLA